MRGVKGTSPEAAWSVTEGGRQGEEAQESRVNCKGWPAPTSWGQSHVLPEAGGDGIILLNASFEKWKITL